MARDPAAEFLAEFCSEPDLAHMTLADAVRRYPHLDWPKIVRDAAAAITGKDEPYPVDGWVG